MVDKSRSRSRNGAGLGLALCVEILRLHDSELEIESKVGEGTCISFVIPDRKEMPEQDAQTAQKDAEETLLQNEIAHKALQGTESQTGTQDETQERAEEDAEREDDEEELGEA